MNGDRTIMVEILNAIEHGTLSVHETRRRLEDIIDKEIIRTDAPANMQLVEECEKLLWELNTDGKLPFTNHLAENKSAVLMYTRKTQQVHIIKKYALRIGAMAAAIFIIVIGTEILFHREWLSTSLSPDGEQLIISGETIAPGLIEEGQAVENNQTNQYLTTADLSEASNFLGVEFGLPEKTYTGWYSTSFDCIKTKRKSQILGNYSNVSHPNRILTINATYYSDIQDAYSEYEQNEEGEYIEYSGLQLYISESIDKAQYIWMMNNLVYTIGGHISLTEAKDIITLIIGESL